MRGKQRNILCFDGPMREISQRHNKVWRKVGAILGMRFLNVWEVEAWPW